MKSTNCILSPVARLLALVCCLSFISTNTYSQLAGTYTIDPAGGVFPNFVSFQAAIDSLHAQGVDGPVVINIADGTYTERVQINQVTGASAANRITFQSASGDSTSVTITNNSPDNTTNWTLRLNGADYVTIRKIRIEATNSTYCRAININGSANYNIIENCQLDAPYHNSNTYAEVIASFNDKAQYNTFRYNYIRKGTHGIFLEGLSIADASFGTQIIGNTFIEQTEQAIEMAEQYNPRIEGNDINSSSGSIHGITVRGGNGPVKVIGNRIHLTEGGSGVYFYRNTGSASDKSLIENNMITIGGSGEAKGIEIRTNEYVNIFHNSVNITSSNTGTNVGAIYQNDAWTSYGYSENIVMKNNVFVNSGGGRACYALHYWVFTESDYNIFYTTGGILAEWDGDRLDLEALQIRTSKDEHSLSFDPVFASSTNLLSTSYWLDGKADPASLTAFDIDGNPRQSPSDIGAFEFDASTSPLAAGTYTIGGSSPDYVTVGDAIDDLNSLGIAGPVTFVVRDGVYDERPGQIKQILGASATDTVVLRSESGNSTIYLNTDETVNRTVIDLKGTDHFTLMGMTISSSGTEFGKPIRVRGTCNNLSFISNTLACNNTVDEVLSIWGSAINNITIRNNYFSKGKRGLIIYSDPAAFANNTIIEGNTFVDGLNGGIMMRYHVSPIVRNNTVTNADNWDCYGIWARDCEKDLVITGNKVSLESGGYGIRLNDCVAVLPFKGLIANNMVHAGGGAVNSYGIQVDGSHRQDVLYNSVHVSGADPDKGRAFYSQDDNEELNIINNILANSGGGYAMFVIDATDISASDNNGYYNSGSKLASWAGTDYTTLATLQGASGMDASSLVAEPLFYSNTDLRTLQVLYHQAALPVSELTIDIDSVERDPVTPDIGAMEFSCGNPAYDIDASITCFGDSTTFIDHTTGIVPLSVISWDFDNDFEYDHTSPGINDTVTWLLPAAGTNTVNYIIEHFACSSPLFTQLSVPVNEPPLLTETVEGAYCGNGNGSVSIDVTGGAPPYSFVWSTGSTESSIAGLDLGIYTVGVSDDNSCVSRLTIEIEERMVVDVTPLSTSSCGASDGSAAASASGGVAPYKYVWSNNVEDASNDSLSPGIQTVNVTDSDGCNVRGFVNIESDGSGPVISLLNRENNDCYGERNGVLEIDISGGAAPYNILWSEGSSTAMVEDLAAGIYDVIVKDQNDCEAYASYSLGEGARIHVGSVVQESNCASADGKAVAVVSGGEAPYHYEWSTGGVNQIEEDLAAGVYSLTVKDAYGCQMIHPVIVNDIAGPAVSLKSITGVNCAEPAIGAIDINISGGTPLYSYNWMPGGETSQDISGLTAGSYSVEASDNAGCIGAGQFEVVEEGPAVQEICIVSVDTLTGKNLLIWSKDYTENVSHYNIYRETSSAGKYQLIDTVSINSESFYLDEVADPSIRSWRYKLSVVDICGEESELSMHHKTMHLTMNKGLNGVVNLIWDHYEGFTVSTYKIWRYDASGGWVNIADVPSNLTSYTDQDPPNQDLTYFIEVLHPAGCESSEKKPAKLNSSRSNRRTAKKSAASGLLDSMLEGIDLKLYPNPGSGIFNINLAYDAMDEVTIKVYDVSGKLLLREEYEHVLGRLETQLDLSGYADGLYQVHVVTGSMVMHRVVVKE